MQDLSILQASHLLAAHLIFIEVHLVILGISLDKAAVVHFFILGYCTLVKIVFIFFLYWNENILELLITLRC